jgi:hypothetical protein
MFVVRPNVELFYFIKNLGTNILIFSQKFNKTKKKKFYAKSIQVLNIFSKIQQNKK